MTDVSSLGNGQKSSSGKAAALLARGAYSQYVSTTKWRERRWRIFSTFLVEKLREHHKMLRQCASNSINGNTPIQGDKTSTILDAER
jgi:hypothetical protein